MSIKAPRHGKEIGENWSCDLRPDWTWAIWAFM